MKSQPIYRFDGRVFVDDFANTIAGYIFNFSGHGAFSPDGKVPATEEQIKSHNDALTLMELETLKMQDKAMLYLFRSEEGYAVGTWASEPNRRAKCYAKQSVNNWGAKRIDVWFRCAGRNWHGVNVGDNDIVRCKALKA